MAKPFLPLVGTILMNILMVISNFQSQIRDRETTLFVGVVTRHHPSPLVGWAQTLVGTEGHFSA